MSSLLNESSIFLATSLVIPVLLSSDKSLYIFGQVFFPFRISHEKAFPSFQLQEILSLTLIDNKSLGDKHQIKRFLQTNKNH
jgi:hypothetical protein